MAEALHVFLFLAAFVAMEGFAWLMHRHVMHGVLWTWHRSHHEPRTGRLERNDLFAVVFALPSILLIYLGFHVSPWFLGPGLATAAYGAVYFLFHDGLVHRRFPVPIAGTSPFWARRIEAHRLHHAVRTRQGCVSFGFLWVRPVAALRAELDRRRVAVGEPAE
ncbi:sterol desaturase family protein [Zavarzinia sp. CC-PAN008]|uniref:sterol desaturase family protein n=1 Tax=Zavarzinia sp. CC-PAN008 TaxID=3243332 RepID=UPI003F743F69